MAKPRGNLPVWCEPGEPHLLDEPAFHLWLQRLSRHKQQVKCANGNVDLVQYGRETEALGEVMLGCERARRFRRGVQEAGVHEGNVKLFEKLCEVARQAEKRHVKLLEPYVAKAGLHVGFRQRQQREIEAENEAMVKRMERTRPVVPSVAQAAQSYRRHTTIISRLKRLKHPAGSIAKHLAQPPKPKQPQGPRLPLWYSKRAEHELRAHQATTPGASSARSAPASRRASSCSGSSKQGGCSSARASKPTPQQPQGPRPTESGPLASRQLRASSSSPKPSDSVPVSRGPSRNATSTPSTVTPEDTRPAASAGGQDSEEDDYDEDSFEEDFEEDFEDDFEEESSSGDVDGSCSEESEDDDG